MWDGLGAHVDGHHSIPKLTRHLQGEAPDHRTKIIKSHRGASLPLQLLPQLGDQSIGRHTILLQRVPVAYRHGAVLRGLAVDGDAERRPGLVLTAVAPSDRAPVVVEDV